LKHEGYKFYDSQEYQSGSGKKRAVATTKTKGQSGKALANWTRVLLKLQEKSQEIEENTE
jgi:hypothetical protein